MDTQSLDLEDLEIYARYLGLHKDFDQFYETYYGLEPEDEELHEEAYCLVS